MQIQPEFLLLLLLLLFQRRFEMRAAIVALEKLRRSSVRASERLTTTGALLDFVVAVISYVRPSIHKTATFRVGRQKRDLARPCYAPLLTCFRFRNLAREAGSLGKQDQDGWFWFELAFPFLRLARPFPNLSYYRTSTNIGRDCFHGT